MTTYTDREYRGEYEGWSVYKREGVPGLRPARPTSWYAVKGEEVYAADTRKALFAGIDYSISETEADREVTARIAASLSASMTKGA